MTPLFFALLLAFKADPAPLIPTGSSSEFQATAYKVEQLIGDGKFEEASALFKRLPKKSVTLAWDDSGVPADLKSSFAMARDSAMADWAKAIPEIEIKLAQKSADIKVSFQDILSPPPDSVRPAGAVFFTSDDPKDPRIEAVVGLKRETPAVPADPRHVQNEVGYAIGSYLGLARLPRPVSYMGRMDTISKLEFRVGPLDTAMAKKILAFVDSLGAAINSKSRLEPTKPQMFVNPTSLSAENVHQGDQMTFSLEVSNRGNAPLTLSVFTECGCVGAKAPSEILPGQSGMVQVGVDTRLVSGKFEKSFVLYSNDPEQSFRIIPIKAWVKPAYQFLRANGHTPVVVTEGGLKDEVFLAIDPEHPFKVTKVEVQGLKVASTFEPWEGEMADPELGQPSVHRVGYKISYLVSPTAQHGRIPLAVIVNTDSKDPALATLMDAIQVQWGIVALPEQMYFGEVKRGQGVAYFILSRPGKPFKVLSAKCDSPLVNVSVSPYKNGDFRIDVVLSPQAPLGRLDATVTVKTDDPQQPVITVPVLAILK